MPAFAVAQSRNWMPAADIFSWAQFEKHADKHTLTDFINGQPNNFSAYRDTALYTNNIDSLYNHLHVLDINGDGLGDIIFEGRDTSEGGLVQFFLNTGKQYKQVFEDRQGMQNMEWQNGKLTAFYIDDWGCCSDYLNFEKTYAVTYNNQNMPVFTLLKQASAVFDGIMPGSIAVKPLNFTVKTAYCKLRTRPVVDDNGFGPWQENNDSLRGTGNIVGLLQAGARGNVIGKQQGKDDVWWYVEIDAGVPLQYSVFYENKNKFPAKKRGWVSSSDIKLD